MLVCYYKKNGKYFGAKGLEALGQIDKETVIWIDLYNADSDERGFVEKNFDMELMTRQEAEEIESSSKYFEEENEINANVNYIYFQEGNYALDPVSFILRSGRLITQRNIPLRSFDEVNRMLRYSRRPSFNGYTVMLALLETRIDIEADFLEDLSKKIYSIAKDIAINKKMDEDVLIDIYNFQELTILFRESTNELKRLFSSILRSEFFPKDEWEKIRVLIKDADSLIAHTNFLFERLEYIQNTFLGLINLEQNQVIKIFSVVAVIFLPPTLIASMYGMNFHLMPELKWDLGYPFAILLMIMSSVLTLLYFRWKKWL